MLTPRDNLLRSLRRQGFEWVPLHPGSFCPSQMESFKARFGHTDVAGFFNSPVRGVGVTLEKTWTDARALYPREELPANATINPFGVARAPQPNCFHLTHMHHPLKGEDVTLDEVRMYPLPRVAPDAEEKARGLVERWHAKGLATLAGVPCTVWEASWYLRSMEDLMTDMMMDDERAVVLFDRMTAVSVEAIRVAARTGTDIVILGDDIGMQHSTMMSVELWRKWLKPRLARIIRAGKETRPDLLIYYHSCGFVLPFLEELIEVGVDILNPVQPECMAFEDVYRAVGGRMPFWGTVGTQTTLPFGTPQDVKDAIWSTLRVCGTSGGLVIAPTHLVEPEVPWANLLAMKEACEAFRL
jgi:uroporphyrinogen decarboxylase